MYATTKKYKAMKFCLYVSILILFGLPLYGQNELSDPNRLSPEQLAAFKTEASRKISALSNYIEIIADKSVDQSIRQKSIELAVKLFEDKNQLVQVSSATNEEVRSYKIGEYLNRLRVLPYSRVDIEWYDLAYVSDYVLGSDGKYYAVATIFQKFRGYSAEGQLIYEDVTQKNIEISLGKQTRRIGDQEYKEWDLLLRQISVLETRQ